MKYNDINIKKWKDSDIDTDSLWLISKRTKTGKHKNIYHGNFIPQIPNQLIRRYTKKNETVLEPFMGSGTTLFECEALSRNYIGFDINDKIISFVEKSMSNDLLGYKDYYIKNCDVLNQKKIEKNFEKAKAKLNIKSSQFVLMHPPYMDIVKFTDDKNDLSNCKTTDDFIDKFLKTCGNSLSFLDKDRYFAIVIGDVYKNSEVIPLGFYCMDAILKNFNVQLKGTIVKNIEGNRGKQGTGGIWRYRALNSDYFIFKHEYIFVFKKNF